MTRIVAGNWKMHRGPADTAAFFEDLPPLRLGTGVRVILFPPAVSLTAAAGALDRTGLGGEVHLGVQNVHFEDEGAFTGETSAPMARQAGAAYALVGHSERRHVFGETDEEVGRKVRAVQRASLVPVVCVGETLEQRRRGRVEEVILAQLDAALAAADPDSGLLLAYEPVWAIGTGETATPRDASEAHRVLRRRMSERLGGERAAEVPILYGGSVKPANADELLGAPAVDGVLVGGASLDPTSFARIVEVAGGPHRD